MTDSSSFSMDVDQDSTICQTEIFNMLPAHIMGPPPTSEVPESGQEHWLPGRYSLDPSIVAGVPPPDPIRTHRSPAFSSRSSPPAPPPFDQNQIASLLGYIHPVDSVTDSSGISMDVDQDSTLCQTETFNMLPAHIVGAPPTSEVPESEQEHWLPGRYSLDPSIVAGVLPPDPILNHRSPAFNSRPQPPAPPPFDQNQIASLLGNIHTVEERTRNSMTDSSGVSMDVDQDLTLRQTETFNMLPGHIVGPPLTSEVPESEQEHWLPGRYGLDPSIITGVPPPDPIRKHRSPAFGSRPSPPAPLPFDQDEIASLLDNSHAIEELYFPNVEHPHINGQPYILEEAPEYSQGWKMSRRVDLDKQYIHKEALERVAVHPLHFGVNIEESDGHIKREFPPVPGQVKMVPGLPYMRYASQNPRMCETVAVFHNRESMAQIGEGKALQLAEEIRSLLVGPTESTRDGRVLPGIWTYDWQRNDRSSRSAGTKAGSYSLGTTKSEGKGHGLAIPATQFRSRDADESRARLSYLVGSLVPLVLEGSIMQEEYDSLKFRGEMVNVPGQGAPENRFTTSLQLNMSYSCFTLVDSIGAVQGYLHVDHQDDEAAFTVFILNFFPRDEDDQPGGFCFPEHALYARFDVGDQMAIFVFKGVSPHGALPGWCRDYASLSPREKDELHHHPPDRFGVVAYLSKNIVRRKAPPSFRPDVGFGTVRSGEETSTTFVKDGLLVFGTDVWHQVFVGTERMLEQYNTDVLMGIHLLPSRDPDFVALHYPIRLPGGRIVQLPSLTFHPIRDREEIVRRTKYWRFHEQVSSRFRLPITRIQFRETRCAAINKLRAQASGGHEVSKRARMSALSREPQMTIVAAHAPDGRPGTEPDVAFSADPEREQEDGSTIVIGQDSPAPQENESFDPTSRHHVQPLAEKAAESLLFSSADTQNNNSLQSARRKKKPAGPGTPSKTGDSQKESKKRQLDGQKTGTTASPNESLDVSSPRKRGKGAAGGLAVDEVVNATSAPSNEENFEVERLVKRKTDVYGRTLYLVRWRGYAPSADSWLPEAELENSREAISEFHSALARGEFGIAISTTLSTPTQLFDTESVCEEIQDDSVEYYDASNPDSEGIIAELQHSPSQLSKGRDPALSEAAAELIPAVTRIFDKKSMEAEICAMSEAPSNSKPLNIKSLTSSVESLRTLTELETPSPALSTLGTEHDTMPEYLCKMHGFIERLPKLLDAINTNKMMQRMFVKQSCRAHIWAYISATQVIPQLAKTLIQTVFTTSFQESSFNSPHASFLPSPPIILSDEDVKELPAELKAQVERTCGKYSELVKYAILHVRGCWKGMQEKDIKSKKKSKQVSITSLDVPTARQVPTHPLFSPFGIILQEKFISIPVRYVSNQFMNRFLAHCTTALQDILIHGLLIPHLDAAANLVGQTKVPKPKSNSNENTKELDPLAYKQGQLLGLGGLLFVISKWLGEGVFTFPFFERLTKFDELFNELFRDQARKEQKSRYFRRIEKGEEWPRRVLGGALEQLLQDQPELLSLTEEANQLTQAAYVQLLEGSPSKKSGSTTHQKPPAPLGDLTFGLSGGEIEVFSLDPSGQPQIHLSLLGFVLREAMAHVRNQPKSEGWEPSRNLLAGKAPVTGKSTAWVQSDHFQPIRQQWRMTKLLQRIIPPELARSKAGLTHFLVFYGYGGSSLTEPFLTSEPTIYSSPNELAIKIRSCEQQGLAVANLKVWGSPSYWFAVEHPPHFSMLQKAEMFFSIQDRWETFLGPERLNINPQDWTVPKPTWSETFNFIGGLGVLGFNHGSLTLFHLVNSLHYSGLVQAPSLDNVVEFIFRHAASKGAIRGLKALGFHIYDSAGKLRATAVRHSFRLLYEHLQQELSAADKITLHFDVIFMENLLCKISRWVQALGVSDTKRGLTCGVEEYAKSGEVQGSLPISSSFSADLLQDATLWQ